jgi:hypothetical protein
MAQQLGYDYICFAQGGRGNLFIAEQIMNRAAVADLVVVNWTYLDRYDILQANDQWYTCLPAHHSDSVYFKRYQNDYRDKLVALLSIKNCVDYIKHRGKNLLMSAQDPLLFDTQHHTTSTIYRLQKDLLPYFIDFEGMNHCKWAQAQGHQINKQGHLLESGHRAVADYMLKKINNNIIKELL